jgi:hypothetical protein
MACRLIDLRGRKNRQLRKFLDLASISSWHVVAP